jgi:NDP-sugar pyrophosphorylase family protein
MRAMILAAGFGTRLRPITDTIPKPLLPVVGVPNIVRTISHLKRFGIRELVLNLHHLPEAIPAALGDGADLGVHIDYLRESPEILGTGGGIRNALPLLGPETFVVVNGDALFAPDLDAAVAAHRRSGALATLLVRPDPEAERLGAVGLDEGGRVRRLVHAGEPQPPERTFMFTGVHLLEPAIAAHLPAAGCVVRRTYIPLLERGAALHGHVEPGYFCDLGTPARYLGANTDLVLGRARLPGIDLEPGEAWIAPDAEIGDGCVVGGGAVIGPRARIAPGVHVRRAVVLDGATVERDIGDAIVRPDGSLVPA